MLDFIKRVAIGVAIAMCVFFLKSNVFALTVESRLQAVNGTTTINTSYVSAGTLMTITPPSGSEYFFTRVFVRFRDQTFPADSYYRFEYQYNVSRYEYEFGQDTCGTATTVSTGAEIVSASYSRNGPTCNVNVGVHFTESMTSVTIGHVYYVSLLPNQAYNFRVIADSWDVTSVDGTMEAIINNTTIISNGIEGVTNFIDYQTAVVETIRDVIYDISNATIGDESANLEIRSYSGTNTSGLGQNDGAGGSGLGSSGSGGYGLNFNDFTAPFAFIFARVEDFLNLNAMFLTYLINIITLGFIGLVLNR